MGRDLKAAKPAFHGSRIRLDAHCFGRPGMASDGICRAGSTTIDVVSGLGEYEVATVYLPYEQGAAVKEACAAFNAVMDQHEAAARKAEAA